MSEWILLGIGLLLTVGTGMFVASEFALVNLNRGDLEARQSRGEKRLGPTIAALKITSTHLSSAQLGISLTTLLTGYTFEPAVSSLLADPLGAVGVPDGAVTAVGAVVGILLATLFSMVIGELVPKNFALAVPLQTAKLVVPFQALFTTVLKPVILLFNNTANAVIRAFGIEPKEELSGARSAEELSSLLRHSARAGVLDPDHATLLDRTLRFSGHDASDVMTPRVRMTAVGASATADEIIERATATGLSRFPVIGRDVDDIVGVLHVKHAFAIPPAERAGVRAQDLVVEPARIPETMHLDVLLPTLRGGGLQFAVVYDEHGGTAGIVTLEDLVEEIIGDLEDEHDRARVVMRRRGRSVYFDASLRPDEIFERARIVVPEDEEYDTVAGFVTAHLGRFPTVGDEVAIEGGVLRVEHLNGVQADRLRFVPTETTGGSGADRRVDDRQEGAIR
ncbi:MULTISPECIES: hemolysin family protein [unclassified Micromonospora]|uniref:hemolysin family protein n=1 Tax=unclassified Micromonospora TaxID=2617518 RepID=UPI0010338E47|nr:hemolysin family protein [Verrucosispora sp. NA02020]QKW14236.1 HlyC/CorC family transporter [Verrucosispora sp. NA02020]TBL37031.1 HlyC/CorC family transporter [Verrucosispora sp. SN26_14.1]